MLTRIHVKGYKSLWDVEFSPRPLSVLLGPNAAGKSNLLDALQLLSRMAICSTLTEAFAPPYRGKPLESFTFDSEGIRGLLNRENARFSIEVDVELSQSVIGAVTKRIKEWKRGDNADDSSYIRENKLRYRLEVEILPRSGILRVVDEYLAALNAKGQPNGKKKAFIEKVGGRIHLRMEGQSHPSYFETGLDHTILSRPHHLPHYPHLTAMRQELASWLFFYFEPRERMREANPVKEVRHIGLMGEDLAAFLNTLKTLEPRQFHGVENALHALIPSVTGLDVDVNDLGEVELRIKEGGLAIPARVVSEGTLRMLGLLALSGAKEPPSLIGFEEPENGIHPRRIQLISELLKTRASTEDTQVFITTHSPLLSDLLSQEDLFICKKLEGATSIVPLRSAGELFQSREINEALNSEDDTPTSISERILRGDFDD